MPVKKKTASTTAEKKNPPYRPPVFNSAEEMSQAVEKYFKSLPRDKKATQAGLALALGFESRQSLTDYANKGGAFSYVIKRAKLYIEEIHEQTLHGRGNVTGAIFWLKCNGWKPADEPAQNVNITVPTKWIDED